MDNLCELSDSKESTQLENLRKRYEVNSIYTYASKLLIAINPCHDVFHLYGSNEMDRYKRKLIFKEPAHIYAIANEAMMNVAHKAQSIIVSGISGSGKTESTKHIVEYLCNASSHHFQGNAIIEANPVLEAFGNAHTLQNENSSRFCKLLELYYSTQSELVGARIFHHSLEVSRVCSHDSEGSNFNIFRAMLYGAPTELIEKMWLHRNDSYVYLPKRVSKSKNSEKYVTDFEKIDQSLTSFGLDNETKMGIYKVLAAILHLGNTEFLDAGDDASAISERSLASCNHAAQLLSIEAQTLQTSFLKKEIKIMESEIFINLSKQLSEKARDNFVKRLYGLLFKNILQVINSATNIETSDAFICVLDIAGFECLGNNTFDQLCINYVNERLQQFFIRKMIMDERHWYEKEGIQIPAIPFFDNSEILGIFDHPSKGIFALLNDECILHKSSAEKFSNKLCCAWNGNNAFFQPNLENSFTIRHFYGNVSYTTTDFIEKNHNMVTDSLENLAKVAVGWLGKNENECVSQKNFKSMGLKLKNELQNLIVKLESTDSHFVRCVKPNAHILSNKFDEAVILQQLRSSSTFSYVDFIRFGFPLQMSIQQIENLYANHYNLCAGPKQFHTKLLLAVGFHIGDFRLGNKRIFFRSNKQELMEELSSVEHCVSALKKFIVRTRWLLLLMFALNISRKNKKAIDPSDSKDAKREIEPPANHGPDSPLKKNMNPSRRKSPEKKSIVKISPVKKTQEKTTAVKSSQNHQQRSREKRPLHELRYDGLNHWPDIRNCQARCKKEDCASKTHFFCSKCNVSLCLTTGRNCFKSFHILKLASYGQDND